MDMLYFLLVNIFLSLYLYGVEYDASGVIECNEGNWCKYNIDFYLSFNDNKWCIRYFRHRPVDSIAESIDSRYDGKYIYSLLTTKFLNESREYTGANIKNHEFFTNIENGGDLVWLSLCSQHYFKLLSNNMIYPFITSPFTKFDILAKTNHNYKVPAKIIYTNEAVRIPKSIEYDIGYEKIKYELVEYTNMNNNIIPIKTIATLLSKNRFDPSNQQYEPPFIYTLYVTSIVPHCSITNFKPTITNNIHICDGRYNGLEGMQLVVEYYSSNWLTDDELTNHPAFIEELKRCRQLKTFDEFIRNRNKYGKIIFFTLIFISTIPLAYFVYKYKIYSRKLNTK